MFSREEILKLKGLVSLEQEGARDWWNEGGEEEWHRLEVLWQKLDMLDQEADK